MRVGSLQETSILSRLTFGWVGDLFAAQSCKGEIGNDDLWLPDPEMEASHSYEVFRQMWNTSRAATEPALAPLPGPCRHEPGEPPPGEPPPPSSRDDPVRAETAIWVGTTWGRVLLRQLVRRTTRVMGVLLAAAMRHLVVATGLRLITITCAAVKVLALEAMIRSVYDASLGLWYGVGMGFLLAAAIMIATLSEAHDRQTMLFAGSRARAMTAVSLMQKTLRLRLSTADDTLSRGKLMSQMSTDPNKVRTAFQFLPDIWCCPVLVLLYVTMLFWIIGRAAVISLLVILLVCVGNYLSSGRILEIRNAILAQQEVRVAQLGEALQSVLSVKYFGWEELVRDRVGEVRAKEVSGIRVFNIALGVIMTLIMCTQSLLAFTTFTTYVLMGHTLTAAVVFPCLYLFDGLIEPTLHLPFTMGGLIQAVAAARRLERVLLAPEISTAHRNSGATEPQVLLHGSYGYPVPEQCTPDGPTAAEGAAGGTPPRPRPPAATPRPGAHGGYTVALADVSFEVGAGELVAVLGDIGSGSTTLLESLLGEVTALGDGSYAAVDGSVAYVPQQAWIRNATLRDNVTLGAADVDEARYRLAVSACGLVPDIATLQAGEATEIGEMGFNLSGGQKQRVNLARAVYADGDIYLLDDPLSAVDAKLGRELFENCVCGALQGKLRILVTHHVQFIDHVVDRVVVLEAGRVSWTGSGEAYADMRLREQVVGTGSLLYSSEGADGAPHEESEAIPSTRAAPGLGAAEARVTEDETAAQGSVGWATYASYFRHMGVSLAVGFFVLSILMPVVEALVYLWPSMWMSGAGLGSEAANLSVFLALSLLAALLALLRNVLFFTGAGIASERTHREMLWAVLRAPMTFHHANPHGRVLNRFSRDLDDYDTVLPDRLSDAVLCLYLVIVRLVVVCISAPPFVIVLAGIAVVFVRVMTVFMSAARSLVRVEAVSNSPIYSHYNDVISGLVTLRAYEKTEPEAETHVRRLNVANSAMVLQNVTELWGGTRLGALVALVTLTVCLCGTVSAQGLLVSAPSPALTALGISFAASMSSVLRWLMIVSARTEARMSQAQRLFEYVDLPSEGDLRSAGEDGSGTRNPWPATGRLSVRNVDFRYRPDQDLVLRDVSFEVLPGQSVGIVGRSGAGKSSILNALLRMYTVDGGEIVLDGRRTADVGLHDLRRGVAVVPQDCFLLSGTVRTALDPDGEFTDAEIWDAVGQIGMRACIEEKGGLDGTVSEGGANFSAGQRQLLCLVRALLQRASVLLLDEATSSVDYDSDAKVQDALRRTAGPTGVILTIAHRLKSVADYDRLLVLDGGKVESFGAPAELMGLVGGDHPTKSSRILRKYLTEMGRTAAQELRMIALAALKRTNPAA